MKVTEYNPPPASLGCPMQNISLFAEKLKYLGPLAEMKL